jgi:cytochrome P450
MPPAHSSSVSRIPYYGELSMAAVRTDPLLLMSQATERLGDIFGYRVGDRYAVLINRPTMIAHVLQGNNRNYSKARTPELDMLLPMLGKGLMTSEGAEWVRQRTMLQPPFRKGVISTYLAAMESATSELIERWRRHPPGFPIEMSQEMSVLAVKVVARALFRSDLDEDAPMIAEAAEVMNAFIADFSLTDAQALKRFNQAREVLRGSVRSVFRRWAPPAPGDSDFLSLLLAGAAGRGSEITDQIVTFLMAGHETTAKALCWTLYLLAAHEDVQERARSEARSVFGVGDTTLEEKEPQLVFCWMVIQESMRLYPPVWSLTRTAIHKDVIEGYEVPADTLVVISPYILHRRSQTWPDQETFKPERFSPACRNDLHPFAYMPFGAGARRCIGRHFAGLELRVVVAMLLSAFRFKPVVRSVDPQAKVTLVPKQGMPMSIEAIR